jgi:predicted branched-subunit amino acid permease
LQSNRDRDKRLGSNLAQPIIGKDETVVDLLSGTNRGGEPVRTAGRGSWMPAARAGAIAVAPIVVGIVPFGLIAGVAAVDRGMTVADAMAFSIGIFAGAAQLAAIEVLGTGGSIAVAVITALVINLRMMMYSASLAPWLADEPLPRRAIAAYTLTDQAYAVSLARYTDPGNRDLPASDRLPFYLGAGATLWATWQLCTITGAVAGGSMPDGVPLGFAIPLVFLALLPPAVTDRPTVVAAVVGAAVATVGAQWPANLGMLAGAVSGIAVGAAMALWLPARDVASAEVAS